MIGTRIALASQPPYAASAWIVVGVLVVVVCLALRAPGALALGLFPIAVGVALFLQGPRRFLARFTPTALEIARPPLTIPYDRLREAHPQVPFDRPRPPTFPIWVVYDGGEVMIPAPLTVTSERVYVFLRERLREPAREPLPEALERYRREQEASFGAERVFAYQGRRSWPRPASSRRAVAYALMVTGAAWTPLVLLGAHGGWAAAGLGSLLLGGVLLAFDAALRPRGSQASSRAALVITPLGLAMQQAGLNGHLTWQEIKKVGTRTQLPAFHASQTPGPAVVLDVSGAQIAITDSYDRALSEIHDKILRYWR